MRQSLLSILRPCMFPVRKSSRYESYSFIVLARGLLMRAVCLKHVPFEGPGAFATALTERGVSLECYLVPQDGLPKDPGDILIVMGGPMSVNDTDSWIAEETKFIR